MVFNKVIDHTLSFKCLPQNIVKFAFLLQVNGFSTCHQIGDFPTICSPKSYTVVAVVTMYVLSLYISLKIL